MIRNFSEGEMLFQRGDPGNFLYGIITGSIRVTTQSKDGNELSLNTMVAGKIGGEIAAFDGGVRTATWISVEPTTVFAIARTDLLELMAQRPEFAHHMVEVLCQRVLNTSQQVEDAAFLSVPERLARQILSMVDTSEQNLPCRIQISQRELAAFLNASRQVVTGCLQEWQRLEFIKVGRGYVEVRNTVGMLERAAQT